jgi:RNA polymerase sigma factor (sigma-70 family)
MTSGTRDAVSLKGLETLYHLGAVGNLTDGQLLERFLTGRGAGEAAEAGFTALVDRHGPMVLRVCRQILGDTHDAQDAFQATFLILVRKAGSVRKRDSVASWLHGIARRVARRARSDRFRRRDYERRSAEMSARTESQSADEPECWPELHEELARLPEKYREPLVLCYLEGLTTDEASRRLGCPQGTVLSRLSRARERLRDRLTRRGLPAPAGLMAGGLSADVVPAALSHSVVQSALRLAAGAAATTIVPASVAGLTRGVLRTMILTKLGITAAAVTTVAALAAGAGALVLQGPAARTRATQAKDAALPALAPSALIENIGKVRTLLAPGFVPHDLKWTAVSPDRRLETIEFIAAQTRANYERIKTWKGTYSYKIRNRLNGNQLPPRFKNGLPLQNPGPLMQQTDGRTDFAIDMASGDIYRDKRTSAITFFKPGTNEVEDVPGVGANDFRSILTKDDYINFRPDEQATYVYLAHLPEANNKRIARRYTDNRMRMEMRQFDLIDPRDFFGPDTLSKPWMFLEFVAKALRGKSGDKDRRLAEEGLHLAQADGPDGRWYCHQLQFDSGHGPSAWVTAFWSPRAGFNPVAYVSADDKPDGKLYSKVEREWMAINGSYVPSRIKDQGYEVAGGDLSKEQETTLSNCVVNQPLDPHQFDHAGLGMADGDLIVDEQKRVGYIIKDGEPVKLGDFVDPARRP